MRRQRDRCHGVLSRLVRVTADEMISAHAGPAPTARAPCEQPCLDGPTLARLACLDSTGSLCRFNERHRSGQDVCSLQILGDRSPRCDALRLCTWPQTPASLPPGLFLWWNCPTATPGTMEHSASEASCSPRTRSSPSPCWFRADRAMLALHAPGTSTTIASSSQRRDVRRVSDFGLGTGCDVTLLFTSVTLESVFGVYKMGHQLHGIDRVLRTAIASYALYMLSHRTASRRLSAVLIACVFHSR